MSSRVLTMAVRRSEPCVSSVSSRALSSAYSSTAYGFAAPSSWYRRRSWARRPGAGGGVGGRLRGPALGERGQRRLEGRGVVRDGLVGVGLVGSGRRPSASVAVVVVDPVAVDGSATGAVTDAEARRADLAEPGQLDEHALAQRLEPEPRLELGVVGGARSVVGGTQALARARCGALGLGQARPVGGIRGVQREQAPRARCASARDRRRDLGPQRVALGREAASRSTSAAASRSARATRSSAIVAAASARARRCSASRRAASCVGQSAASRSRRSRSSAARASQVATADRSSSVRVGVGVAPAVGRTVAASAATASRSRVDLRRRAASRWASCQAASRAIASLSRAAARSASSARRRSAVDGAPRRPGPPRARPGRARRSGSSRRPPRLQRRRARPRRAPGRRSAGRARPAAPGRNRRHPARPRRRRRPPTRRGRRRSSRPAARLERQAGGEVRHPDRARQQAPGATGRIASDGVGQAAAARCRDRVAESARRGVVGRASRRRPARPPMRSSTSSRPRSPASPSTLAAGDEIGPRPIGEGGLDGGAQVRIDRRGRRRARRPPTLARGARDRAALLVGEPLGQGIEPAAQGGRRGRRRGGPVGGGRPVRLGRLQRGAGAPPGRPAAARSRPRSRTRALAAPRPGAPRRSARRPRRPGRPGLLGRAAFRLGQPSTGGLGLGLAGRLGATERRPAPRPAPATRERRVASSASASASSRSASVTARLQVQVARRDRGRQRPSLGRGLGLGGRALVGQAAAIAAERLEVGGEPPVAQLEAR